MGGQQERAQWKKQEEGEVSRNVCGSCGGEEETKRRLKEEVLSIVGKVEESAATADEADRGGGGGATHSGNLSQRVSLSRAFADLLSNPESPSSVALVARGERQVLRRSGGCRPWMALLGFMGVTFSNSFAWFAFSSVSDLTAEFYSVSVSAVDWLVLVYMVFYGLLVFLGTYINERRGLRKGVMIGATFTCAGSLLRLTGVTPKGFIGLICGQCLCAFGQCFILSVPPALASLWFPQRTRAIATSLGVLANQVRRGSHSRVVLITHSIS